MPSILIILYRNKKNSLVIVPENNGNIGFLLSGINNTDPNKKKKENVKSARFSINGEVHVILYASRDIKCGEILYYNYNGLHNLYPTEHFE